MDHPQLLFSEFFAYWLAVAVYIAATVYMASGVFFNREHRLQRGHLLGGIGLIPHAVAISLHWYRSGHGPYLSQFESISSTVWISLALHALITIRLPRLKALGLLLLPVGFLLLGLAIMTNPAITYLPGSFQTIWLVFHIFFNKLAFGAIMLALGCAIFYLVKCQRGDQGFLQRVPDLATLDLYAYQFCGFCFAFWTITVIAGSIWANKSWGRYWAWDPIETWSVITWLCFALYLHLRRFHGLKGKKGAYFLIGCFAVVLLTLFLIPVITKTVHTEYLLK